MDKTDLHAIGKSSATVGVVPALRPTRNGQKRVVVVGGGLGGFAFCKELVKRADGERVQLVLVDPLRDFVFKPILYEKLNGRQVSMSRQAFVQRHSDFVQFIQAKAERVIRHADGSRELETSVGRIGFDYLILAPGAHTNYFGVPGAQRYALPLLTPQDVERFEASIDRKLQAVVNAIRQGDPLVAPPTFEIIGAGPSGVELAFELRTYLREKIRLHYPRLRKLEAPHITLIEAMDHILPGFTPYEQVHIKRRLQRQGIEVLTGHMVKAVEPDHLQVAKKLPNGELAAFNIPSDDPVWVAGLKSNLCDDFLPGAEVYPGNNRMKVNEFLEVPNDPSVYVIGDASGGLNVQTGRLLPPTGQVVDQQACFVARDLALKLQNEAHRRPRKPFAYQNRGHMISLGPGRASVTFDFLPKPFDQLTLTGPIVSWLRQGYYGRKIKP